MKLNEVSKATIGRIPLYLNYLKSIPSKSENISATSLAKGLGMGEVQVRKDLASVCGGGRPKTGYNARSLIDTLEKFLKDDEKANVIIVGAGKLGRALLDYNGFKEYGTDIEAAFDIAYKKETESDFGKKIYPMSELPEYCKKNSVKIGIITVPSKSAQEVCDILTDCGVRAIWCFAPCLLSVPDGVFVQYENMALSLAYLNKKIIK